MLFSERNLKAAWMWAQGRCEGMVEENGIKKTCSRLLIWEMLCSSQNESCRGYCQSGS
jgi:hypothetical protein